MLLFVLHELWSIIDDSGSVVSSVVPSHPALLSFHMLAGNLDRARSRETLTARCALPFSPCKFPEHSLSGPPCSWKSRAEGFCFRRQSVMIPSTDFRRE